MPRLGIVCRLNACNVGDSAMYDNLVAHLPMGWEPLPITDGIGAAEECIRNGYPGATTEMDVDVSKLDAVVVGGGDFDPSLIAVRLPTRLPVLCLGLSLGPRRLASGAYRDLLSRARHVFVRDLDSAELLASVRADGVTATCDLAWDLPYEKLPPSDLALVTLRAPVRLPPELEWTAAKGLLVRLCEMLDGTKTPWRVFPCNTDDAEWSCRAGVRPGHVLPIGPLFPGDAAKSKAVIGAAPFIVTIGRLHPAIFAAACHVPVVGVATRQAQVGPKLRGLFNLLRLGHLCIGADAAGPDALGPALDLVVAHDGILRGALANVDPVGRACLHWQGLSEFLQ